MGVRIYLQNVVSTVNFRTEPNLNHIAVRVRNVEYNPQRFKAAILRLLRPQATALIFSSGKMVVTGAKNEDDALLASKNVRKILHKVGVPTRFTEFKVQNIVGSTDVGFPIRLEGICDGAHHRHSVYEPELFPGLVYRMESPKVVLLIFVSGKVVLTGAKTRSDIRMALQKIYPVLVDFRKGSEGARAVVDRPANK